MDASFEKIMAFLRAQDTALTPKFVYELVEDFAKSMMEPRLIDQGHRAMEIAWAHFKEHSPLPADKREDAFYRFAIDELKRDAPDIWEAFEEHFLGNYSNAFVKLG